MIYMNVAETVTCPSCKQIATVDIKLKNIEVVENYEKEMGNEVHYQDTVEYQCKCKSKLEIPIDIWEYPVGVINLKQVNSVKVVE